MTNWRTSLLHTSQKTSLQMFFILVVVVASLLLTAALLLLIGQRPLVVLQEVWFGAFGNTSRLAAVFNFWVPLTLTSLGLTVTFRAGLWNMGVEGQIMIGAISAGAVAIFVPAPAIVRVPTALIVAIIGGALWGLLEGTLKIRLGVHEIFGGVALNAIANAMANYLISGLWSIPGGNSRDTGPFDQAALLHAFSDTFPASVNMIAATLIIALVSVFMLRRTRWGLYLKAVGKGPNSARLFGVPTEKTLLFALAYCGGLAGLVGAYRSLFTFGTLRSLASGGIGFLGILTVLLANTEPIRTTFVTFAFAALLSGSTQLRVATGLDASLTRFVQEILLLLVLIGNGLRGHIALIVDRRISTSEPQPDQPFGKKQGVLDE